MTNLFSLTHEEKKRHRKGTLAVVGVGEAEGYVSRRQYDLAMAAGLDAGNASMRASGRTTWAVVDYERAIVATDRLLTHIAIPWPGGDDQGQAP